jgi:hypothetical protein
MPSTSSAAGGGGADSDTSSFQNNNGNNGPSPGIGSDDDIDGGGKAGGEDMEVEENNVDEEEESDDDDDDDDINSKPKGGEVPLFALPADDKHKFNAADTRRKEDDRALISAHSRLLKLRADLNKAQAKVDDAQKTYDKARNVAQENAQIDADDLLLEPTPWNNYYTQLDAYYDREGHSNFKRTITDADVEGLSEQEAKEIRTLSWWTCRQRKFKRRGELEQHKVLLLDRLKFNWDPHAGPGPEKWLRNYALLKEFKAKHGHVKVPVRYAENKLGSWLKTQVSQYRNAQEGKLPALSAERISLLEEIGVNWGEKRVTTPWDDRFRTLMEYRRQYGNVNVPWQWKENVALAQWVNSQRKKYKDLLEGKRNNLNEEQIHRLNAIGFKWNTGGKGRYTDNPNEEDASTSDMASIDVSSNFGNQDLQAPTILPSAVGAAQPLPGMPSETGMMPPPVLNQQQLLMPSGLNQQQLPADYASAASHAPFSGTTPEEYSNYLVNTGAALNNGQQPGQRPMLGSMTQESLTYAQRLAQQNQTDLSMLAYAYQHMHQQFAPANLSPMANDLSFDPTANPNLMNVNGGNPFLSSLGSPDPQA